MQVYNRHPKQVSVGELSCKVPVWSSSHRQGESGKQEEREPLEMVMSHSVAMELGPQPEEGSMALAGWACRAHEQDPKPVVDRAP